MNLIDILKNILETKNQIRVIVGQKNEDFSLLPTDVFNYLASEYNEAYLNGYSDKWMEVKGVRRYPASPVELREYNVDDTYYDPYDPDGLTDLMRGVLGYKLDIKDSLTTEEDYFPYYPDLLTSLKIQISTNGYNDGSDAASEDISGGSEVEAPSLVFDSETNSFTLSSSQAEANLYYSLDDGMEIRYENDVTISEPTTIRYFARIGRSESSKESYTVDPSEFDSSIDPVLLPPVIVQGEKSNTIFISQTNSVDGVFIQYKIGDESEWSVYTSPITITPDLDSVTISARAFNSVISSSTNSLTITYYQEDNYEEEKCENVSCSIDLNNTVTLSTETEDASIYYRIDSESTVYTYTEPFTINTRMILYTWAEKEGYRSSDTIYYALTVREQIQVYPPIIYANEYVVSISNRSAGCDLYYKLSEASDWIIESSGRVVINLSSNTTIYAKSVYDPSHESEVVEYVFDYYNPSFVIPVPGAELINNRVVFTSENEVLYTTDGSDPKVYGNQYMGIYSGFIGIPIQEPTTFRYCARGMDSNYRVYYSDVVENTFIPESESESVSVEEYFSVLGASEIHVEGAYGNLMTYSYDQLTWTSFGESVSGLDPERRVYLRSSSNSGSRPFSGSMSFGSEDHVSARGNIASLLWIDGETFSTATSPAHASSLKNLFKNCSQLTDVRDVIIPFTSLEGNDLESMFEGCSSLVYGVKNLRFNTVESEACKKMYSGCSSLVDGGSFVFSSMKYRACESMYEGCSSLTKVGEFLLDSVLDTECAKRCFKGCSSLNTVFLTISSSPSTSSFEECFMGCSSLSSRVVVNNNYYIQNINISSQTTSSKCYKSMFEGCSGMRNFGSLPSEVVDTESYSRMFAGCSSLYDFGSISATTINGSGMAEMFLNCTSLTTAPTLLAHDLTGTYCYQNLFRGCSSLNYIQALFVTDPTRGIFTSRWVDGVSESGVFVQAVDADWDTVSVNAIPIGWSVVSGSASVGVITDITIESDIVSIFSSKDNDIYYQFNSTGGEWIKYEGPFLISYGCVIYAKCVNNHGDSGPIFESDPLYIEGDPVDVFFNDNRVRITSPATYTYEKIFYRVLSADGESVVSDWSEYSDEFRIYDNSTVQAYGEKRNGNNGPIKSVELTFGVLPPSISVSNNTFSLACESSDYARIEYLGQSDLEWNIYTDPVPFNSDSIIKARSVIISSSGRAVYSEELYFNLYYSGSGGGDEKILYIPVLLRKENENKIYLNYGGVSYTYYNENTLGVRILYRISTESEWSVYDNDFMYRSDITVEAKSVDLESGNESETATYSFTYSPNFGPTTPTISFNDNIIRISAGSGNVIFYSYDNINFYYYTSPITITETVTVFSYSKMNGRESEKVSRICEYEQPPVLVPEPTITYNNNTITISAELSSDEIYYSFNNQSFNRYNNEITIGESVTVYAYARRAGVNSSTVSRYCEYEEVIVVNSPNINYENNVITISKANVNDTVYYSYNNSNYYQYTYPITINQSVTVYAKSYRSGVYSSVVSRYCEYRVSPGSDLTIRYSVESNANKIVIIYHGAGEVYYSTDYTLNTGAHRYTQPLYYINEPVTITAWVEYNDETILTETLLCRWDRAEVNVPAPVFGKERRTYIDDNTYRLYVTSPYINVSLNTGGDPYYISQAYTRINPPQYWPSMNTYELGRDYTSDGAWSAVGWFTSQSGWEYQVLFANVSAGSKTSDTVFCVLRINDGAMSGEWGGSTGNVSLYTVEHSDSTSYYAQLDLSSMPSGSVVKYTNYIYYPNNDYVMHEDGFLTLFTATISGSVDNFFLYDTEMGASWTRRFFLTILEENNVIVEGESRNIIHALNYYTNTLDFRKPS